jgi:hypothetical protein
MNVAFVGCQNGLASGLEALELCLQWMHSDSLSGRSFSNLLYVVNNVPTIHCVS